MYCKLFSEIFFFRVNTRVVYDFYAKTSEKLFLAYPEVGTVNCVFIRLVSKGRFPYESFLFNFSRVILCKVFFFCENTVFVDNVNVEAL